MGTTRLRLEPQWPPSSEGERIRGRRLGSAVENKDSLAEFVEKFRKRTLGLKDAGSRGAAAPGSRAASFLPISRGDIVIADWGNEDSFEMRNEDNGNFRGSVVVQNDSLTEELPLTILVPATTSERNRNARRELTCVYVEASEILDMDEQDKPKWYRPFRLLCYQPQTKDKRKILRRIGRLSSHAMMLVDNALRYAQDVE